MPHLANTDFVRPTGYQNKKPWKPFWLPGLEAAVGLLVEPLTDLLRPRNQAG